MTAQSLREEYGDQVRVEYIDFASEQMREKHASMLDDISKRYLSFPVTTVDGQIISHGFIDYWDIVNFVQEKLEAHKQSHGGQ